MKSFLLAFMSGLAIAANVAIGARSNIGAIPSSLLSTTVHAIGSSSEQFKLASPSTILKQFSADQIRPPKDYLIKEVRNTDELIKAIAKAHAHGGKTAIYLHDGEYALAQSIFIRADDIMLLSVSSDPYKVTLKGLGMKPTTRVNNILQVRASGFVLDGIRLTDAPNHLIQIAAENSASRPIIRNCILQDSYEQLIKVSYDQVGRPQNMSFDGVVEHCIFQYTKGIAPYFYTGGIDALGARRWRVENNIFKDIASPGKHIAQHAVHFWVNASDNKVVNNVFIDNDRAIGFGMKQGIPAEKDLEFFSKGGLISGNVIYHSNNGDPYADTGIILEASPETVVEGNYIFMQHSYPRAIEYRFEETQNALIQKNFTNKSIRSSNGGHALVKNNHQDLEPLIFFRQLERALTAHNITNLKQPLERDVSHD